MSNKIDPARTGQLCAILAKRFPDARPAMLAKAIVDAQRAALAAKRAAEYACNYAESEEAEARRVKREAAKEAALCASISEALAMAPNSPAVVRILLGGDPRGACGILKVWDAAGEVLPGDGWGGSDAGFPLY